MALKQHKLCNLRNICSIIHVEDKLEQEEIVVLTETLALLSYQITFYHAFENVELDFAGSRYRKEDFCSTKKYVQMLYSTFYVLRYKSSEFGLTLEVKSTNVI